MAEGGWVKSSHGSSIKNDGYADYAAVRKGEYDDGIGSCVNTMDFRYNSSVEVGAPWSWFHEAYDLVKSWHTEGTYRIYPTRFTVPEEAVSGSEVSVSHQWANLGCAYCPTNTPQYHGKYRFALALLNPDTHAPVRLFFDDEVRPCDWVKGKVSKSSSKIKLDGVAAGSYIWAAAIVNSEKDNTVGIELAVKKGKNSSGWVEIAGVTIK